MKIFQSTELSRHPIDAMEAATKFYVDQAISTGAIVGGVFFTDVSPASSGIVGAKQYAAGTIPANKVIVQAVADTNDVQVTLFAEGGTSFYSPSITITTVPPQAGGPIAASLTEDLYDKRSYTGTAILTNITVDTLVTATSSTGATATVQIIKAAAGPTIDFLLIGAYPGSQTEVKLGDIVMVSGRVANSATYVEVLAAGASNAVSVMSSLGAPDSFGTGFKSFSGTFVASNLTGSHPIQARAQNTLGTFGATFTSTNNALLNQTYPTIGARTITYPVGQQGLKSSESATITASVTNFDVISYSNADGNLAIANTATFESPKTVTRVGGTYQFAVNNYTITATRTANNAVSTASSAVTIAHTAPTAAISITGNPARLFSSAAGTDYTVVITANQRLLNAPSLVASSGTWQGSWVGSGTTWSRVLRIVDTDPKGSQLFSSLSLTGLAGVAGSVITSGAVYVVGGFVNRTITFPAFARYAPIGTSIVDINKVMASYTGSSTLTRYNDTGNYFQGFTIVDSAGNFNATGDHLFISDAAFAGSNTTGTLQLDIQETV